MSAKHRRDRRETIIVGSGRKRVVVERRAIAKVGKLREAGFGGRIFAQAAKATKPENRPMLSTAWQPTADDIASMIRGRIRFPVELWGDVL